MNTHMYVWVIYLAPSMLVIPEGKFICLNAPLFFLWSIEVLS